MNDIKSYREKELKMYILACIFILLCLTKDFSFDTNNVDRVITISKTVDTVLASSCLYIFVFIMDSIFSSDFKKKVVTIFGLIKMPGEIIFIEIKDKCRDKRFTREQALVAYEDIYKNLPDEKKKSFEYQNARWYKIYSKHRDVAMIFVSNRDYLFCRDMVFATISIVCVYSVGVGMKLFEFNFIYVCFLVIMFVVNIFATHLKAKRFAYNVLAYDISLQKTSNQNSD